MYNHLGDTERHTGMNKYKSVLGVWGSVVLVITGKERRLEWTGWVVGCGQKKEGGSSGKTKQPTAWLELLVQV